ncbi:conjugative transfer signal peptidase TraF [Xanthobacter sp. DSM 24535]|uniref:Conjugation peptidase TraF n=1 Tax=Aquabacter spiritensis TaxID=933073 RepID=A0A4R3LU06_9HYPH|nr:conjugative transfer signal peptidase TraF [Aquabacter spiritensis]OYX14949.1 MAG: conjugative transfer signal peptidase TraF [Rhizobiales bacterium 32-66-8]TCT01857.1 conjugation peptidase TraF [Aquabacter spiritensis]
MKATRRRAIIVGAVGAAVAGGFLGAGLAGYRINVTPSYPVGLWRVSPLSRPAEVGDLVLICPPASEIFERAKERGYLLGGPCPGWIAPLIKKIVAVAGQQIDVGAAIRIDGRLLPHSDLRAADAGGRPLIAYSGGVVPAGFLFLHSEFEGSYDSRYFGPVPAAGVIGLAQPVLTFGG